MLLVRIATATAVLIFAVLTVTAETTPARVFALIIAVAAAVFLGMLIEDAGEVPPGEGR